jgi:CCR4-NOT transcription complex subunit 6
MIGFSKKIQSNLDRLIILLSVFRYDFKGIIDYIFYQRNTMTPLGLLGPISAEWMRENKVIGCPHPHVPSGWFSLS